MTTEMGWDCLADYRITARNTAADSENKIHDDTTAARYGFKGGLVPGVTVYGYMTVPAVRCLSRAWLEHGIATVKFVKPFYEGDHVMVRSELTRGALPPDPSQISPTEISISALKGNEVCAVGKAWLNPQPPAPEDVPAIDLGAAPLPSPGDRLRPEARSLGAGRIFGTLETKIDFDRDQQPLLEKIEERLPIYRGPGAVAHPMLLLSLANQCLVGNVDLGPWIHAQSHIAYFGTVADGEHLAIGGTIRESFERKGNEFVILDLMTTAGPNPSKRRLVQHVLHTAIYKVRTVER